MVIDCRHYIVSGHVQGVFFRSSTQETAASLRLDGWVRNLPDGRVEVLAQGDSVSLDQFRTWLRKGPPLARVEKIQELDSDKELSQHGFYIR